MNSIQKLEESLRKVLPARFEINKNNNGMIIDSDSRVVYGFFTVSGTSNYYLLHVHDKTDFVHFETIRNACHLCRVNYMVEYF